MTPNDNVLPFPGPRWTPDPLHTPEPGPPRAAIALYRVRVDLDGTEPPIWRRLEVASDLTLERLHEVLQIAMGWSNSHLHHFVMGSESDRPVQPFLTQIDIDEGDEGILESDVRLDQVLSEVGDRLFYEYDFGDSWDHTIELEAVAPYVENAPRARCVGGARACPPEDCGGVGGYAELVEAVSDPWREEALDWLPHGFDPEKFSVLETDELLQQLLSSSWTAVSSSLSHYDDALVELVESCARNPTSPLPGLVTAAALDDVDVPTPAMVRRMVHPWLHLLELVGSEGAPLTQAGYLKPEVVSRLSAELEVFESWMGKGNREDHTKPVADLRASATAIGLVRKHKGRLVLTPTGRTVAGDPGLVWDQLAAALPLGKERYNRHAGVVALLAQASGLEPGVGVRRHGAPILSEAGWTGSDRAMDEWMAFDAARPTLDALWLVPGSPGLIRREPPTEAARQLARAALLRAR